MGLSLIVVAGVVVLGAGLLIALGGTRGLVAGIAVLALAVAGGAAFLLLGRSAAVPPVAVAVRPVPAAAAPVAVESAPLLPEGAWTAAGRVLRGAKGEEPLAGAVVEVFDAVAPPPFGPVLAAAAADAEGGFRFEGLLAPNVRIRASAPGCAAAVAGADAAAGDLTLRLLPGGRVEGRVLEKETKAPVPGARVQLGEGAGVLASAEGTFVLEGAPRGKGRIEGRARGFARGRTAVDVGEAPVTGVEILLRPGAIVSGTVFGPDGSPAEGAVVTVSFLFEIPFAGGIPAPVETDPIVSGKDGAWTCEEAPAGRGLRVAASAKDSMAPAVDVPPLARGEARTGVDLRLALSGAVLATVVDGKGVPVEGASVEVLPADEKDPDVNLGMIRTAVRREASGAKTDARGVLRVAPVAPGPVKVTASHPDYRGAEQVAVTGPGAETVVSLVLDAGAAIRGKVVDGAGAPVAGASVSVRRFGGGLPVMQTRTTGEDGAFRVGGLSGGGFLLRAQMQGFVDASLAGLEAGGEEVLLTLAPGGAIAGTVTDGDGKPVTSFRVNSSREGDSGTPNPMDWERFAAGMMGTPFEDPAGRFRLEGLEPGNWKVEVTADALAPAEAAGIAVAAGEETEVALVLPEGLVLRGVVVRRSDGTAVPGATVRLPAEGFLGEFDMGFDGSAFEDIEDEVDGAAEGMNAMSGFSRTTVRTGADGRFEIRGLEEGKVRLMASFKGLAPQTVRGISVPAAEELRIELSEEAAIEGTVTDASGAPKAGAMVMIQRVPMLMRMATTDASGRYRIGGVGAGPYLFYVMEGDLAGMAGGAGLNMKSEPVTLEEGKTVRKDHRLGEGIRVTGRVTRGGEPVGSVMVMMLPASGGGPMGMMAGGGGFAMGSTKEDGTFLITGVNPGRYTISVQTNFGGGPGGGDPLEVPKGSTEIRHDIRLPENAIRGVVLDESGEPVSGAVVRAVQEGKAITHVSDIGGAIEAMGGQAFTGEDGRFEIGEMKPGTYRVEVQAQGFPTKGVEGVAAVENGPEVRVVLSKGEEVRVRVLDADGAPVSGAALFLSDAEGRELTNLVQFDAVRTGEDGRASLRAPPGTLRFEAQAAGHAPGETRAEVPGGEVVIRLPRAATLRVTVLGPGGGPLAGAGVEVLDAEGNPWTRRMSMEDIPDLLGGAATGTDGTWTRAGLPAGSWRVRASAGEGRTVEESFTLAAGEEKRVTLRIP